MAKKPTSKILAGQRNGGQWRFDIVFETKDGVILEGTRAQAVYAESQFSDSDKEKAETKAHNVGVLLRERTRELLKREGL